MINFLRDCCCLFPLFFKLYYVNEKFICFIFFQKISHIVFVYLNLYFFLYFLPLTMGYVNNLRWDLTKYVMRYYKVYWILMWGCVYWTDSYWEHGWWLHLWSFSEFYGNFFIDGIVEFRFFKVSYRTLIITKLVWTFKRNLILSLTCIKREITQLKPWVPKKN